MRPVVREGDQREKPLVSECSGCDGHDFQKSAILWRIAPACVCARWMAEGWSGGRWCFGLHGQPVMQQHSRLERYVPGMAGMCSLCRDLQALLPPLPLALSSPERGTYLILSPSSLSGPAGSGRNSAEARHGYVTARKEKPALNFHSLFCSCGMGEGGHRSNVPVYSLNISVGTV